MSLPFSLSALLRSPRTLSLGFALGLVLAMDGMGLGEMVDSQLTNRLFQHPGTRFQPSPEIVLVSIDDATLQIMEPKVGRWPWPRSHLARLVEACEGASCIGVDILFPEEDRAGAEGDARFAGALRQQGRVVLAGAFVENLFQASPFLTPVALRRSLIPWNHGERHAGIQAMLRNFMGPFPLLAESACRLGHANFFPSRDHILRAYPYAIATEEGWMPSLAVATWMCRENAPGGTWSPNDRRQLAQASQPRDLVFYRAPFRKISAVDLLEKDHPGLERDWAHGRMVLIGVEAQGLHDLRATPMSGAMSGLEIHATALSNWLQGVRLASPPVYGRWLLVVLGALLPLMVWDLPFRKSWPICVLAVAVYHVALGLAFYLGPLRLPWILPMTSFGTAMIVRLLISLRHERERRRRMEELQKMKRMLSNMLLHDLNAPLTSILMLISSVLPEQPPESRSQRRLKSAMSEAQRLTELLKTLLDIERLELGRMQLKLAPFAWEEMARVVAARLEPLAAARNVSITVTCAPDTPLVCGDRGMLERVLLNLLDNAVRHAATGTTIECKAGACGQADRILIGEVMNHGPVLDHLERERIFGAFVRNSGADQGERRAHFGLGLAFCKLAIAAHGGSVECKSPPSGWNEGVSFEFSFPLRTNGMTEEKSS